MERRTLIASLFAAALGVAPVMAQDWPNKPVTLVVPFGAGTSSDVLARGLAEALTAKLGQGVIVLNKGGAGGNIGAAQVARSAPDGYTFLFATTGQAATNKLMYKEPGYDSDKDLQPVALLGKLPVVIVTKKGGKFGSISEMLAYAKANPGKLNAGFPGNGTLGHITGLLFARQAGIELNAAQYAGSSKIIGDLLGGHIDVGMDSVGGYMAQVQKGDLQALALASAKRFGPLPNVPTVAESGLKDFEATVLYALMAPAGTPAAIVTRLNAEANAYLASDAAKAQFSQLGVETAGGSPADLKAFIAAEQAKWGPVIKDAKISF